MIKSLKIIARILIILFCIFTLFLIVKQFLPLEYADNNSEYLFENLFFLGFPTTLLLTLFFTLKEKDGIGMTIGKIAITIVVAVGFILMIGMLALENMCDWSTERTIFENKQNNSIKIVDRSFGCGATDSGAPTHTIFRIREITGYFIWATKIDTNTIDKSKWNRITKIAE
jgi:hypothetical protein